MHPPLGRADLVGVGRYTTTCVKAQSASIVIKNLAEAAVSDSTDEDQI